MKWMIPALIVFGPVLALMAAGWLVAALDRYSAAQARRTLTRIRRRSRLIRSLYT
jgi:hypothetical protein